MRKKKVAAERSELLRSDFILTISDFNPEQLIFIDEHAKDGRNDIYTNLLALTLDGFIVAEVIKWSCTKEFLQAFIINQVIPQINLFPGKNSIIIINNARIHHDEALVGSVEGIGGKVIYLPLYSSDFSLTEIAFLSLKACFKKYRDFPKFVILIT
ncbi:hypothetical protein GLOIN_2v1435777 [Rhizophagus clarus]|uniref:Tc1-like transposase DDE domain-containing protein n=1 Tax=Rhizophagus clarus TaxID=94130 RepID=A0A8H3QPS3_9GLOM|nr:hypothetical protein GLOIN_2v1435777 [Rhizophagus clarus]